MRRTAIQPQAKLIASKNRRSESTLSLTLGKFTLSCLFLLNVKVTSDHMKHVSLYLVHFRSLHFLLRNDKNTTAHTTSPGPSLPTRKCPALKNREVKGKKWNSFRVDNYHGEILGRTELRGRRVPGGSVEWMVGLGTLQLAAVKWLKFPENTLKNRDTFSPVRADGGGRRAPGPTAM